MTDTKDQYIETTNLYWEMLWKAQRIEDKKLVELIRRRLAEPKGRPFRNASPCRVIPFHEPAAAVAPLPCEATFSFWPKYPLTGTLSFLGAYFMLIAVNLIAGVA
jgi:hypothetical protein